MRGRRLLDAKSLASISLTLIALLWFGCVAPPLPDPAQTQWVLDPDRIRPETVILNKGESRESVVERMGYPQRKEHPKTDPSVEIYYYERLVQGGMAQRTGNSVSGMVMVRKNTYFVDRVKITFRNNAIEGVVVDRRLEEYTNGVPIVH